MNTYFIATMHPEYADRKFPEGSTVIDPWRYIPDQPGVTVRRLGQNRPAMISVLLPSRGRPDKLERMLTSLWATVAHRRFVEAIVYLDDDDQTRPEYMTIEQPVEFITGPRKLLSENWNECAFTANGEILMHAGDDITFDTPGWDTMVRQAFDQYPDKILFAHGDDLGPHGATFGTHGFVHRRWVQTVGYFLPPLFSSDWNDVWLNELADNLGRKVLLPFVTEHHHYIFGKAERDRTHAEREERGAADDVVGLYQRTASERQRDTDKLKAVLA